MYYASGTSIIKFPENGLLIRRSLTNQGQEVLEKKADHVEGVPILGLLQTGSSKTSGRIAVYGDSNCIDTTHIQKDCYWLLHALVQYSTTGLIAPFFETTDAAVLPSDPVLPKRMEGNRLYRYSKVFQNHPGVPELRALPPCQTLNWAVPQPLNESAPSVLWKSQKLLSVEPLPLGAGAGGVVDVADDLAFPSLKQRWGGWALQPDEDDSRQAVSASEYFSPLRLALEQRRTVLCFGALTAAICGWLLYRRCCCCRAAARRVQGRKGRARRRILSLPISKLLRGV